MKLCSYFFSLSLSVLFVNGMTLNTNIGSNWAPHRKGYSKVQVSREAVVSDASSVSNTNDASPYYSTLPNVAESTRAVASSGDNSNLLVVGSPGGQGSADYYAYQQQQGGAYQNQQESQQYQQFYQNQPQFAEQPDFNFIGQPNFAGFANTETGLEEANSDSGFLSQMSNLIDSIPVVGSLVSGVREMFASLGGRTELSSLFSGGSLMSAMALPMMIPMAMVPVAMGALGLLAFPILQMTLPGIRRSFTQSATFTQDFIKTEECVERISCNLARIAKKIPYEGWISSKLDKSDNKWLTRVSRSLKAARTGEECAQFTCSPITQMQKKVRSFLLGNKNEVQEKVQKLNQDQESKSKTS